MLAEIHKRLGSTEIKTQIALLKFQSAYPVSYTHLTLPTIYSV